MLVRSFDALDYADVDGYANATSVQQDRLRRLFVLVHAARIGTGLDSVTITSWLRPDGSLPHRDGAGIDFTGPTRDATLALWIWLANFRRDDLGEVAYEQPKTGVTGHVHLTLPGYGGMGQILYQNEGGSFVELDPFLIGKLRGRADRGSNGDGEPFPGGVVVVRGDRTYRLVPTDTP